MRTDPTELRRALQRIAAPQGGYFTAAQALRCGYSYSAQTYHRSRGTWEHIDHGLLRLADWPVPEHAGLIRWSLWSRGRGVVSHLSALDVHGLGDSMPERVTLTVPPTFRARGDGVVLRRARLDATEVQEHEGFRVTDPLRSLLDVAADGPEPDHLARAVRDASATGVADLRRLRARLDDAPPAAWARRAGAALAEAAALLEAAR